MKGTIVSLCAAVLLTCIGTSAQAAQPASHALPGPEADVSSSKTYDITDGLSEEEIALFEAGRAEIIADAKAYREKYGIQPAAPPPDASVPRYSFNGKGERVPLLDEGAPPPEKKWVNDISSCTTLPDGGIPQEMSVTDIDEAGNQYTGMLNYYESNEELVNGEWATRYWYEGWLYYTGKAPIMQVMPDGTFAPTGDYLKGDVAAPVSDFEVSAQNDAAKAETTRFVPPYQLEYTNYRINGSNPIDHSVVVTDIIGTAIYRGTLTRYAGGKDYTSGVEVPFGLYRGTLYYVGEL